MIEHSGNNTIYSVSALNRSVSGVLEQEFGWVWVEGEISNLAQPASGHIYFSLKDSSAQVSCAMFKGRNRQLTFLPENGLQVLVRAKVSLYQPRGNYQLIVDRMEEAGAGALRRQFEQLKVKLAAEGLFEDSAKQEIPELPSAIAVITSKTGAAIHDVLSVIQRRFPSIPVKILPVPVQGHEAAPAICHAIELIGTAVSNGELSCDLILLVRGGGSLEDLWAYNEESVARAMFDCPVPIISGIGHEVDVTIADYVADVRAATPTAAAETATPDQSSWLQSFDWYHQQLQKITSSNIRRQREKIHWLHRRLQQQHPEAELKRSRQRSQQCLKQLLQLNRNMIDSHRARLDTLNARLHALNPAIMLQQKRQTVHYLSSRLQQLSTQHFDQNRTRLANLARTLNVISPLHTLERGYSITLDDKGKALLTASQVRPGEIIKSRLHDGQIESRVESCITNDD